MTPMDWHRKLHPESVCKSCLGPQSLCCPVGHACTNSVPDGLQCSWCLEKANGWGYPTFNALFCTRSDPFHQKPELQILWKTVCKYLDRWSMEITPEMICIERPEEGETVYRAHEAEVGDKVLHSPLTDVGAVPSFNTRTGVEVFVPAGCVVPEPLDHPTDIPQ